MNTHVNKQRLLSHGSCQMNMCSGCSRYRAWIFVIFDQIFYQNLQIFEHCLVSLCMGSSNMVDFVNFAIVFNLPLLHLTEQDCMAGLCRCPFLNFFPLSWSGKNQPSIGKPSTGHM